MQTHQVRALLMGGQACVFYGAAEFSRDTDLALLPDAANLARLRVALTELQAEPIAVPPFELKYLKLGFALHFRCFHPEAMRMRVDIMSKMRGVDSFARLWRRRTTIELPDGSQCDLLSLPDLVRAKKTQRDKDWPMIRRLVECHYFAHQQRPNHPQIRFWLKELRSPQLLIETARLHPLVCQSLVASRPLLALAALGYASKLEQALSAEESRERAADRKYWAPLLTTLEKLRHAK
jgi:hypothetical protein